MTTKSNYTAVAAGRKLPMESIGTEVPNNLTAEDALASRETLERSTPKVSCLVKCKQLRTA